MLVATKLGWHDIEPAKLCKHRTIDEVHFRNFGIDEGLRRGECNQRPHDARPATIENPNADIAWLLGEHLSGFADSHGLRIGKAEVAETGHIFLAAVCELSNDLEL